MFIRKLFWDFEEFTIENNISFSRQTKSLKRGTCARCGVKVSKINEYAYLLREEVWNSLKVSRGLLCLDCVEKLLNRKLLPTDFDLTAGLNTDTQFKRSPKLMDLLNEGIDRN